MKAVLYESFCQPPKIASLPDPAPEPHGVVIAVGATGVCRSDWHGWMGHDPDIALPHVPGDRVTVPFVGGCGHCAECHAGHQQVCDHQFQPGFTHWGSFAEYVSIHRADLNLVRLPETLDFATAASLGCRFITSFRAVIDQGRVSAGEWVAVHGCGGVGLSAVMIATAAGAQVVAVDISDAALKLAERLGAVATVNAREVADVAEAVRAITGGGAHVSLDALGSVTTCVSSIMSLRKRGRHIQVGLMAGEHSLPPVPMGRVIGFELEILGSHGMQAHRYDAMFSLIERGALKPEQLVGREITLEQSIDALTSMDRFEGAGVTVVTSF